jgi:hypothetical protein
MAREFLQITAEQGPPKSYFDNGSTSHYGVFYGSGGTPTGTRTILQLTDSNQFTVRPVVMPWEIRAASGYNRRLIRGSGTAASAGGSPRAMVQGTLGNCIIYDSQATFWFGDSSRSTPTGNSNTYGMLEPVPSGTPPGGSFELNSYTIDHAILMDDASNTVFYRRYLGCRVQRATISADSDSQLLRISCDIIGHGVQDPITSTDFPEPTFVGGAGPYTYPVGNPFVLAHASSYTFGQYSVTTGSGRQEFESFNVTIENLIDSTFFNSTNLTRTKFCGRNVNASVGVPFITKQDRLDYEAATTPHSGSITFNNTAATHSIVFNFHAQHYTSGVTDNLDYNRVFRQNVAFVNFVDTSVPSDLLLYGS